MRLDKKPTRAEYDSAEDYQEALRLWEWARDDYNERYEAESDDNN